MMRGGEEQKKGANKAPVVSEAAKAALETIRVEFYEVRRHEHTTEVKVRAAAAASVSGVNKVGLCKLYRMIHSLRKRLVS